MWTTPKTDWQINEIVDAADMNAIGDNLAALKAPPSAQYTRTSADYTTTSTSFVDVDATNLAHTITTTGGDVLIVFVAPVTNSASASNVFFDVLLDGVRIGGTDGLIIQTVATAVYASVVCFAVLKTGLAAGSHTFKLQWKVGSGTGRIYAGSSAGALDIAQFWVREVS